MLLPPLPLVLGASSSISGCRFADSERAGCAGRSAEASESPELQHTRGGPSGTSVPQLHVPEVSAHPRYHCALCSTAQQMRGLSERH